MNLSIFYKHYPAAKTIEAGIWNPVNRINANINKTIFILKAGAANIWKIVILRPVAYPGGGAADHGPIEK